MFGFGLFTISDVMTNLKQSKILFNSSSNLLNSSAVLEVITHII